MIPLLQRSPRSTVTRAPPPADLCLTGQSHPFTAVPFPCHSADPSSPTDSEASDVNVFLPVRLRTTDAPMDLMDQKYGAQSPSESKQTISLRWLDASSPHHDSGARLRVPSLSPSVTTAATIRPEDASSVQGGDIATEGDAGLMPAVAIPSRPLDLDIPHMQHGASRGDPQPSVLQFFTRTFTRRRQTSTPFQSSSLASSPVTLGPSTPSFASNPSLTHFSAGPRVVDAFPGALDLPPGPDGSTEQVSIAAEKRPDRNKPQDMQGPRKRTHVPHSDSEHTVPFNPPPNLTAQDLQHARDLYVLDQDGKQVRFGDLWQEQRTCVIFIRHFWCPLCADYTQSIVRQVDPVALGRQGVKLVVISNGSPAMIKPYQKAYKLPFPLYTDPSLATSRALGMTLRTTHGGPESKKGDYIRHSLASGLAMVIKNAVKARMPIHKSGGNIRQLGGEFVLGPGLTCSYASRMHNTRSHAPVKDVLAAAGVKLDSVSVSDVVDHTIFNEEDEWMEEREAELRRIRARRGTRRGFAIEDRTSESDFESDFESDSGSDLHGISEADVLVVEDGMGTAEVYCVEVSS